MHQLRRTRRLLVAVPTALLAVSLVGCSNIGEDAAEKALEEEGLNADIDGTDINIEGTDFNVTTGELPKDFPVDEVPVVDGEIIEGTYAKNSKTWTTTVEVGPAGGDKQAAYDDAEAALTGAGATVAQEPVDNGSAISGVYATASHTVTLSVTDSNRVIVNYLVAPK
ncbi:hypothetical protein SFC88_14520 [Nocardioides sp. HM23]|uniref:hypothetical protein n=1 Tax=Nocardioides bizhenqiangii TaxID=3095076 RepID=UPI002ACAD346|nr:hypothetical protein [Nocardioides sp. HM23]MDZ5622057.1 hypothetical protein [Nocardioides sp. HM23]